MVCFYQFWDVVCYCLEGGSELWVGLRVGCFERGEVLGKVKQQKKGFLGKCSLILNFMLCGFFVIEELTLGIVFDSYGSEGLFGGLDHHHNPQNSKKRPKCEKFHFCKNEQQSGLRVLYQCLGRS